MSLTLFLQNLGYSCVGLLLCGLALLADVCNSNSSLLSHLVTGIRLVSNQQRSAMTVGITVGATVSMSVSRTVETGQAVVPVYLITVWRP